MIIWRIDPSGDEAKDTTTFTRQELDDLLQRMVNAEHQPNVIKVPRRLGALKPGELAPLWDRVFGSR